MAREDEFHDDNLPPPPPVTHTQQAPHTLATIKLPILKKEDHLAKFHKMTDSKDMWEVIKSRFGEGLHKGYDKFQSLLSQLKIDDVGVSTEDVNQKFLRSLPASWSQVSLIMRTKPGVDTLSFDDFYNNLRVFESDIKGSTASSSSTQNVAFVSSESTNSTNNVGIAYGVSTSSGHNSQKEGSSSYTDKLKYSFFANQSSGPQLDHKDLEQGEDCSLIPRNQLALTRPRLIASIFITQDTLLESADQKEIKKAKGEMQGTLDGVDWTGHAKDEQGNFALMAYNNSGSYTE
ncbi:hypothetical protein Tco_0929771, partial [Tanacetum coccineum]